MTQLTSSSKITFYLWAENFGASQNNTRQIKNNFVAAKS